MDWNKFAAVAIEMLLPLVVVGILALITMATNWLREKAKAIKNEVAQKATDAAVVEMERIAVEAISSTNQRLVDDLKAKRADGKLEPQEIKDAMKMSLDYMLSRVKPDMVSVLMAGVVPIREWLEEYLEGKLSALKWGQEAYDLTVPPSSPASEPAAGPTV